MELISVIVPVFKVEAYLDKCVRSIVDQTYRNLEIILVDDGSPDRCGEMCDTWAEKDSRIKVIHQENAGGAAARNSGLNVASGELIAFVDSDDYLAPSMYQRLYDVLLDTGAEIAECDYLCVADDFAQMPECTGAITIHDTKEALYNNLYNISCKTVIWNKLYRKDTIDEIRFVEGKTIDDEFFTYRVIGNAALVAVTDDILYFYRQQEQSVMHQAYSIRFLDALEACALRRTFISARFPDLASDARIIFWKTCMYHYQKMHQNLEGSTLEYAEKRFDALARCRKLSWADFRKIRDGVSVWFVLSKVNFKLTCRLRNFFGIGL